MSAIFAKLTANAVSRVATRQVACYSTEAPAAAKFDVSSFIGRIDALHAAQAKKGEDKRTGLNFKLKRPAGEPRKSAAARNASASASASARRASGASAGGRPFNKDGKNRPANNGDKTRPFTPRQPRQHGSGPRNAYTAETSGPAKPTKNLKRYDNMEIDSALTDSSSEKLDLHVSPNGGVLFDNNSRRTASASRGPRKQGQRNPGQQRFANNNNNGRSAAPRFGGKKGSPRVQRKNASAKDQERRRVTVKLTPEQAMLAVSRRIATQGSTISVPALTTSTISPYVPGLGYSAESRILRAIQRVPQPGKYTEAELKALVNSTCKGTLDGFKIPEATDARGQESIIPVLNNNKSYSPELKNFFLKLASGETPMSSLRK